MSLQERARECHDVIKKEFVALILRKFPIPRLPLVTVHASRPLLEAVRFACHGL
ncbi:hypothetical protein [Nitrosospira multiformis]|uniref:hypothetical protein n=1 Tax=Nitrosospira multiformis TaxID=1231 RepID=UPI00159F8C1E|nr:hypothetical protein [Nitrosospira multiformis]